MITYTPFTPHPYAQIAAERVYAEGSVPEAVYAQLVRKYETLEGVDIHRITYISDGHSVTGIAALPKDAKPKVHPLVIYNRGGSREYGKLTVLNVINLLAPLAREGYIVFASNYRGNDGGEGREQFGGVDVNDVLSLLTAARTHPAHDGRNVYMAGHSRGGMMTYLALKEGVKVNAAVAIAAIADLFVWSGQEAWLDRLLPKEEPREQAFNARSAVCWPGKLSHTPLLLLHGARDEAVSHTQSEALAAKLSAVGAPHALHIYENGNHALVRQWPDVTARTLAWFEEHAA